MTYGNIADATIVQKFYLFWFDNKGKRHYVEVENLSNGRGVNFQMAEHKPFIWTDTRLSDGRYGWD